MRKKEIKKYNNVLGIDLGGASRNGLALYSNKDKKLLYHKTIKRYEASSNLEHRNNVIMEMKTINEEYGIDIIIFEAIRLFSYGKIQLQTILSLNKMQTTIINEFSDICDIYQVDVRSWKSRVLGSANADKSFSLMYIKNKYPNVNIYDEIYHPRIKETEIQLNHDICDAICISEVLKFDNGILQDKNKMNFK